jgi:hypothetical protein
MADSTQEVVAKRPKSKAGRSSSTELPSPELKTAAGKAQKTAASDKAQAAAGTPEKAAKPKTSFMSLLTGRTTGPDGKPAQPGMGRFFFGMSLYMVLALGAQVGLGYLFQVVPGHGAQVLVTLPIVGPVTLALFTWMVVLIGILFALYKFNILPRSLGGQQRQKLASVKASDTKTAKAAPAKPAREPLSGPNDEAYQRVKARIRAERRKERRH